jgi:hypothetical protein
MATDVCAPQHHRQSVAINKFLCHLLRHIVAGLPCCNPHTTCVFLTCLLCSYQTTDLPAAADMQAQYMEIARALDPYVDIFLAETLSTAAEAQAAVAAAASIAPGGLVQASGLGPTHFHSVPPNKTLVNSHDCTMTASAGICQVVLVATDSSSTLSNTGTASMPRLQVHYRYSNQPHMQHTCSTVCTCT